MENINLISIFLTGLLTGGLTCMAVQGGLLAATIAQREEARLREGFKNSGKALPILSFLVAKLIAYTALGFLLGVVGSVLTLSITAKIILQVAVVIFMLGTAFNILEVHPIFRYFVIQPPKFLTRLVRKQSQSQDIFAPGILGAFTIFIPCGTTQAMMALSIASGSPVFGALILFAFILGTSPLFFILGYFATVLGEMFQKQFMRIAAIVLIILALVNLNSVLLLKGIDVSQSVKGGLTGVYCTLWFCDNSKANVVLENAVTEATITFGQVAYQPDSINVKKGQKITLHLVNKDGASCIQAFTIPSLGIQKVVPVGSKETITFTSPDSPTQIPFMCSMGMFRGVINVL
jgi:sulfite exporter TauE/SafE